MEKEFVMKMTYRVLFILILSSSFSFGSALKITAYEYRPYMYEENGKTKGIVIDVVKEVFKRMNEPISIRFVTWTNALRNIKNGKFDALSLIYKNKEREKYGDYSSEVLIPQKMTLFVRNDSKITFDGNLSKFEKYKIGVIRGFSYGPIFDTAVKNGTIKVDETRSLKQNISKLLVGRYDIIIDGRYVILDELTAINKKESNTIVKKLSKNKYKYVLKELSPPIETMLAYMMFSKKNKLTKIRDKFDLTLKEMKEDGSYQRILESFFK